MVFKYCPFPAFFTQMDTKKNALKSKLSHPLLFYNSPWIGIYRAFHCYQRLMVFSSDIFSDFVPSRILYRNADTRCFLIDFYICETWISAKSAYNHYIASRLLYFFAYEYRFYHLKYYHGELYHYLYHYWLELDKNV